MKQWYMLGPAVALWTANPPPAAFRVVKPRGRFRFRYSVRPTKADRVVYRIEKFYKKLNKKLNQ